ncbi:Olfactory receptor 5AC1, partial [Galemys pyrenaicus]
ITPSEYNGSKQDTRLTDRPGLQVPLFLVFLAVYLITMVGNLGLILLIWKDPHLHTPMYFFLGGLAFADAWSSSSVTPRMLVILLSQNHIISLVECFTQFYVFAFSATTECFLLVVMAYDRYVAICNPLLYPVSKKQGGFRGIEKIITPSEYNGSKQDTGLTDRPGLQVPLFLVFLIIYLITMVGNLGLILLIWKDPHLHTPIMLVNLLDKSQMISLFECMTQYYFFGSNATTECFLLVVMAYDRYVAICNPLLYPVVMSNRLCMRLITLIQAFTFMTIIVSYTRVLFAILKKKSEKGRSKAFSTCSAHLLSVSLFYGTLFFMYVRPGSGPDQYQDKMYSLFYTIIIPLLNPFIYSLRNKEVLGALRKAGMAEENKTQVTEFILIGLTDRPELHVPLFLVFLVIYLITMVGNLGLIYLIWKDPHLHTPIATTECFLLVVMAYDRYVAICNPLLYPVVMSHKLCTQFIGVSYVIGFLHSAVHVGMLFRLTFCKSNVIPYFYCEILQLFKISCTDPTLNTRLVFIFSAFIQVLTFMTILISYTCVLFSILKKKSEKGRSKAFSTCSAHLLSVSLFYGTLFFMYVRPGSDPAKDHDKMYSLFYTIIIPLLNPFIYSLRNK